MSSTTERQRGQILVVFAGGLVAFLAVAALVFDVGQNLLDWRAQRDAADASALAGSRYIADPADVNCAGSPSLTNCPTTVAAALRTAELNGYGDGSTNCAPPASGSGEVCVAIPPTAPGNYTGMRGFLQVTIHTDRPSFFAAVLGVLRQNVDALAIAGNSNNVAPPYSMLALNPDCTPNPSGQVSGNGDVTVGGAVVVNSTCDGALQVNGNAVLDAPECDVGGTANEAGSNAQMNCGSLTEGFSGTGDPLANVSPGPMPTTASTQAVEILKWNGGGTATIPAGCPGSTSQITLVGDTISGGNSTTLPAFAAGDLAVVFAYRTSGIVPPDLPTGWTDLVSDNGQDGNSRRIGYRVLDGTELDAGTWTNATSVEVIVVRGQDTDTPIGVHASGGSAGSTLTTPALSGMRTDGHSWVIAFGGANGGANVTTLAGATALSNGTTPSSLALHYRANITTWSSQNYGGSVTGPNRTDAVEILANPNPSTLANPAGCTFNGPGGSTGTYNVFRIHPGLYPGGLSFKSKTRVYLAPGTYWIAGGGITLNGKDAQIVSVDGASSTTPGRGVFIYDTEDPNYHDQCIAGTAPAGACIAGITVNGTSSTTPCPNPVQPVPPTFDPATQRCQWIHLEPASSPTVPVTNLLIMIDRNFSGIGITINGSSGLLELSGTIYDPNGSVFIGGNQYSSMAAQIIAYTFDINGSPGTTLNVTYDAGGVVQLKGVGLVQ